MDKKAVKQEMKNLCLYVDYWDACGELNSTSLAEDTAFAVGHPEWLDDPDHWVWDLAVEAEDWKIRPAKWN